MTSSLTRTWTSLAVVGALAFAVTPSPQAQAGTQQGGGAGQARDVVLAPAVGTGLILGQVVTGDTGTPVRRARVALSGTELRVQRSTLTDDEGRFVFTQLPPGRYSMTASKVGYVNSAYGAKAPGRPGTPIQLEEGQKLDSRTMSLPRGGVVSGVVLDEYGEPSPGTPVRALRTVIRTGEKRLESAGTDTTDDRGMYRIYDLQPGQYVVTAQPRNTGLGSLQISVAAEIQTAVQLQLDADEQSMGYAPVFYPGTTTPSGAMTVDVESGQKRYGVDFQLQLVSTAQVTGTLSGVDGTIPQGTQIALALTDAPAGLPGASQTVRANQTGGFSFRNVTPGDYRLTARAQVRVPVPGEAEVAMQADGRGGRGGGRGQNVPSEILWAHSELSVAGHDISDVALQLQKGMSITGRVAFDGTRLMPPQDLSRVRVTLATVGTQDADFGGIPAVQVDASGRFTFNGVPPGRYALRGTAPAGTGGPGVGQGGALAAGGSGNWMLKSSIAGGRETLDFPLELGPNMNITDAVLTFGDQSTQITGLLQDARGTATADFTIIVFPTDPRFWVPQARRIQAVRPGTDGRYTIRNLPSGDYGLAAVTDVEPGEWFDPAFLQQLLGASMRLSLAEGEQKTQDVRLSGGL